MAVGPSTWLPILLAGVVLLALLAGVVYFAVKMALRSKGKS